MSTMDIPLKPGYTADDVKTKYTQEDFEAVVQKRNDKIRKQEERKLKREERQKKD